MEGGENCGRRDCSDIVAFIGEKGDWAPLRLRRNRASKEKRPQALTKVLLENSERRG